MIKTNHENLVIPIKIRVLDKKLNLYLQNIDFGIIQDTKHLHYVDILSYNFLMKEYQLLDVIYVN